MSLRNQILDELESAATKAAQGLIGAAEREALRRRAEPCKWASFHRLMARRLPKVRWIARLWHRGQYRRRETQCEVARDGNPIACALCDAGKA